MKILFLDLEGTIIKSVDDPRILFDNILRIKRFLENREFDKIKLFSFAIYNESDIKLYHHCISIVEDLFKCKITDDDIVTKHSLLPFYKEHFNFTTLDEIDFLDLSTGKYGKEIGFQIYCRHFLINTNVIVGVLIDDMVKTTQIRIDEKQFAMLNVFDLK
jgi:hypothetical protein